MGRDATHKGPSENLVARSVLIVKLAAIGDIVMALPMVTALRAEDAGHFYHLDVREKSCAPRRLVEGIE